MMSSTVQGSTMAQMVQTYGMTKDTKAQKQNDKTIQGEATASTEQTEKTGQVSGRVIGDAKLSEKAAKYYDQLKHKFSKMEFILVSEDQKQTAQAQATKYGNNTKPVVLINEEKLERMAEDESYRSQYEGIISASQKELETMGSRLGSGVKTYGVQIDDKGMASYFAVVDKSFAAQRERMAKKAAQKKVEQKAEEKKAKKKERQEALEKQKADAAEKTEDLTLVTASSADELITKVDDLTMRLMSDYVQTEQERKIGQNFDFKL